MNAITDLNDLRLFSEVVEHGSYTAAARSLGLQTSKLSRRIRALEEELGVRLLNRTSRSLSLTETGRQFHQHCLALVAEAKAAKDIVDRTRSKPQGTVRIACAVALLESGISTMIARYIQDNPDVQVLLDATNRRVDVVEEGLDFAIRVRIAPLENTDLAVRQLGLSIRILVASPELAARYAASEWQCCPRNWLRPIFRPAACSTCCQVWPARRALSMRSSPRAEAWSRLCVTCSMHSLQDSKI